jgi:hypothetical protein
LIAEEFETHSCKIPIKKHVKIMAGEILDLTNDSGKALLIDALDGVSYMIEIVEKGEPLPWSPNENTRHRNQTGTTQNQISGSVNSSVVYLHCQFSFGEPEFTIPELER